MPFPLKVGDHTWEDGPGLLAAVISDARSGGGEVIEGSPPSAWLADLVDDGSLEPDLAMGLVAALLQKQDEAGAVVEAARLAVRLGRPELAELVLMSLDAFDTALLLTADPLLEGASVEDALLDAAFRLADLDDDATRARLLPRLRNAGLAAEECTVVALHGSPDEIRTWLPAVLLEGLPERAGPHILEGLARGGDATDALVEVLSDTAPRVRDALAAAIEASPRRKDLVPVFARIVPGGQAEA